VCSGELEVYGLFYLAESGIFTRYDELSQRFVPLAASPTNF
jgi:hypothetical protein